MLRKSCGKLFVKGCCLYILARQILSSSSHSNSIVNVDDFLGDEGVHDVDVLAAHLHKIMSNETLYNSYHAWR